MPLKPLKQSRKTEKEKKNIRESRNLQRISFSGFSLKPSRSSPNIIWMPKNYLEGFQGFYASPNYPRRHRSGCEVFIMTLQLSGSYPIRVRWHTLNHLRNIPLSWLVILVCFLVCDVLEVLQFDSAKQRIDKKSPSFPITSAYPVSWKGKWTVGFVFGFLRANSICRTIYQMLVKKSFVTP